MRTRNALTRNNTIHRTKILFTTVSLGILLVLDALIGRRIANTNVFFLCRTATLVLVWLKRQQIIAYITTKLFRSIPTTTTSPPKTPTTTATTTTTSSTTATTIPERRWRSRSTASQGKSEVGDKFYENVETGETTWDRPDGYLSDDEFKLASDRSRMRFKWNDPPSMIFKGGFQAFTLAFPDHSPAEHLEQLFLLLSNLAWTPTDRWEFAAANQGQLGKQLFSDYFSLSSNEDDDPESRSLTKSVRDWSLLCLVQICRLVNIVNGDVHAYVHDVLFSAISPRVELDRAFIVGFTQGIVNIDMPHHHHAHDSPEKRKHKPDSSSSHITTPQPAELERQSLLDAYLEFAKLFLQAKYDCEFERRELERLGAITEAVFEIGCQSTHRDAAKVLVSINWFCTLGIRNELTVPSLESTFVNLDVNELVGMPRPSGGSVVARSTNLIARSLVKETTPVVAACVANDKYAAYLTQNILFFLNALGGVNVDGEDPARKRKIMVRAVSDRDFDMKSVAAKDSILFEHSLRCVLSLCLYPTKDLFFVNDFKLLIDLTLRELTNLAPQSFLKFTLLNVLLVLIMKQDQFEIACNKYRIADIAQVLNDVILLKADERVPVVYRKLSAEILALVETIMC